MGSEVGAGLSQCKKKFGFLGDSGDLRRGGWGLVGEDGGPGAIGVVSQLDTKVPKNERLTR
jgi:hypothetical protein